MRHSSRFRRRNRSPLSTGWQFMLGCWSRSPKGWFMACAAFAQNTAMAPPISHSSTAKLRVMAPCCPMATLLHSMWLATGVVKAVMSRAILDNRAGMSKRALCILKTNSFLHWRWEISPATNGLQCAVGISHAAPRTRCPGRGSGPPRDFAQGRLDTSGGKKRTP
jgi:hypothetical protein